MQPQYSDISDHTASTYVSFNFNLMKTAVKIKGLISKLFKILPSNSNALNQLMSQLQDNSFIKSEWSPLSAKQSGNLYWFV